MRTVAPMSVSPVEASLIVPLIVPFFWPKAVRAVNEKKKSKNNLAIFVHFNPKLAGPEPKG